MEAQQPQSTPKRRRKKLQGESPELIKSELSLEVIKQEIGAIEKAVAIENQKFLNDAAGVELIDKYTGLLEQLNATKSANQEVQRIKLYKTQKVRRAVEGLEHGIESPFPDISLMLNAPLPPVIAPAPLPPPVAYSPPPATIPQSAISVQYATHQPQVEQQGQFTLWHKFAIGGLVVLALGGAVKGFSASLDNPSDRRPAKVRVNNSSYLPDFSSDDFNRE